jgi:adenosine kinase
MAALICGSVAYDTIMVFSGRFRDHILPEKIHILNVSFLVPGMRREYGGCAGNIAYNLGLLGAEGYPMATVGRDFQPYAEWMSERGISLRYIRRLDDEYTAQAYITTDVDDNQITAFHPGAMNQSHRNQVPRDAGISIGVVSPDGKEGMLAHAREFSEARIPFMFDPGQGLPMFDANELGEFLDLATWVTVNDYEMELLSERTGLAPAAVSERLEGLVVTRGAQGSVVYIKGNRVDIPAAVAREVRDPTGCGDAYRAGLLHGLMRGLDWETTGRIASLMGAIKIESHGTQNHRFAPQEFRDRYVAAFGRELDL